MCKGKTVELNTCVKKPKENLSDINLWRLPTHKADARDQAYADIFFIAHPVVFVNHVNVPLASMENKVLVRIPIGLVQL